MENKENKVSKKPYTQKEVRISSLARMITVLEMVDDDIEDTDEVKFYDDVAVKVIDYDDEHGTNLMEDFVDDIGTEFKKRLKKMKEEYKTLSGEDWDSEDSDEDDE